MIHKLRIYIDTSVAGGCFGPEFAAESQSLFEMAKRGEIILLLSSVVLNEIELAPKEVDNLIKSLPSDSVEFIEETEEAHNLKDAYIAHDVLSANYTIDALHVALATVNHADILVSWNFKHMVHLMRIRGFARVNIMNGLSPIEIRSPKEVV